MPTTLTSREFNRNPSAAKRVAEKGPVIITDRGRPRFVLVDYDQYEVATKAAREDSTKPKPKPKPKPTLFDVLGHPASADINFEPPKMSLRFKPVDFAID